MKAVRDILEARFSIAMTAVSGGEKCPAMVTAATDPKFGDYQVNGVMAVAKQIKTNPRKLAEEVVSKLNTEHRTQKIELLLSDICEQPEVAGPGFINLRLKGDFIAGRLIEISKDSARLGIDKALQSRNIVVDFSSPNIAKEMHVGHLRSTIIGDCICRLLEFLGHKVIRQNHIGDWGTQFGMLIASLKEQGLDAVKSVADAELLYREAKRRFDTDEVFATISTASVVDLQRGEPKAFSVWRTIYDQSLTEIFQIYDMLGGIFSRNDVRGESFYSDRLGDVVNDLLFADLAKTSDGAVCVFPPGFEDKEGKPLPVIIRKSDGAYLYATTDLAAIRYRVNELKADRIVYVTDARQALHFQMLFAVAEMAGWNTRQKTEDGRQKTEDRRRKTELVHVTFGSVLGENGKPLKTREGENVKLKELLDEAVERAKTVVDEKNPELPSEKREEIAKAVGIGAVKYADFCNNRTSDYVFSLNKMLAMDGNTAPYMQYAYARIKSIGRKAQERGIDVEREIAGLTVVSLTEPSELDLAKQLIRYGEAVESAADDYRPNYLTAYLYELAQRFSAFYTNCPVLDAGPDKRPTRLLLCDLTARTIEHGLDKLLGIKVVEQM